MNFEDLQKAWQTQDTGGRLTIDPNYLLREVRRNQHQFRSTIFWRDFREVGTALCLTVFFCYSGWQAHDWTFVSIGIACFGVGAFMVMDRLIQHKKRPAAKDPLKACIEVSLLEVKHQVWLLKNVFWWYMLPIMVPFAISVGISVRHSSPTTSHIIGWLVYIVICIFIDCYIYWINQLAVRKTLKPRQQELEELLANLQ